MESPHNFEFPSLPPVTAFSFLSLVFSLVSSSLPPLFLSFSNTLLCSAVLELLGKFSNFDLSRANCVPYNGLVKKSPIISCVGQCAIFTSRFLILSVTKKYRTFRCLVRLSLDVLPFSASSIVLLLSW